MCVFGYTFELNWILSKRERKNEKEDYNEMGGKYHTIN